MDSQHGEIAEGATGHALTGCRPGCSNLNVTALSLGCAPMGTRNLRDQNAIEPIQAGPAAGINYIDTALLYGESERRPGVALAGQDRTPLVISTKTGIHPQRLGEFTWRRTPWSNGSTMAHGRLTGQNPDHAAALRLLGDLATLLSKAHRLYARCWRNGWPVDAIVRQYALRQALIRCTLTGVTSRAQIEANLPAATAGLPYGIWEEMATHGFCQPRNGRQLATVQEPST